MTPPVEKNIILRPFQSGIPDWRNIVLPSIETATKLIPLLREADQMEKFSESVLTNAGINLDDLDRIAHRPKTIMGDLDPAIETQSELVAQHIHLQEVLSTTIKLKSFMIEKGMPDRIFAYQTGTGFPLPQKSEKMKHIGHLSYGEGILRYTQKPGVAGHTDNEEIPVENRSGFHFYEVTSDTGKKASVVVIKGRYHGYEAVHRTYPHLELALIPRVLKGIGTESILTTFATGFDAIEMQGQDKPQLGDYGYVMVNNDLSRESVITHPGVGNQMIIGPEFGGPFRPGPQRASNKQLIGLFESSITRKYPNVAYWGKDETGNDKLFFTPTRRAAYFTDGSSTPDFENAADWAKARIEAERILKEKNMFPPETMALIPTKGIAIAHGMSATPELAAYYQKLDETAGGLQSKYNREIPVLAIAGCTDGIDPRWGGDSANTTHDVVQKAAIISARFIQPVLSAYFQILTDSPVLS